MSSARRRAASALLPALLLVLACGPLLGCSGGGDGPAVGASAPPDVASALTRALDARAAAVRAGDPGAFARLLGGSAAFRRQQRIWFANLRQLPVAELRYELDPGSLVRRGDGYWATVREVLRLDGYDVAPVATPARFHFVPGARPGRMRLTSVRDRRWEARHHVHPQPWTLGPVQVRRGAGVLGVFDAGSVAAAPALLRSVESAIADVAARVPYEWDRTVVVYALSEPTFLDGIEDLPGNDPGAVDAVSFTVGESTRFVLNPDVLDRPGPERDRLVRHELTHVAVGRRDDHVPVWLSEGLAEWVSALPLAPEDRELSGAALAAARAGTDDLPADATFNDDDSQAHYGIAWWAVASIADTYGEGAPWAVLDAMAAPGADPERVLEEQFGTDTRRLAEQADALILALYGAADPSPSAAAPSGTGPSTPPTPTP